MGTPMAGVDADVWITASPSVTIGATPVACTDSGDHITYTAAVDMWDKTKTLTVQCSADGVSGWATVTDYTMQWPIGRIVFATARTVGVNNYVRINAGYTFTATQLDGSYSWSLSLKAAVVKSTAFQATNQWETKITTVKSGTGQIATFQTDDRMAKELTNLLVFKLYSDKSANHRWTFYGYLTEVAPKASVDAAHEQTLTFTVEEVAYFLMT